MSIVTLCGASREDADCSRCLRIRECHEAREAICRGCIRDERGTCPAGFKHSRIAAGMCRGRELIALREFTQLHERY